MQSTQNAHDNIVQACFQEHICYGSVLRHAIEKSISGRKSGTSDTESSYKMGISLQLEAIGVGGQVKPNSSHFLFFY